MAEKIYKTKRAAEDRQRYLKNMGWKSKITRPKGFMVVSTTKYKK